MRSTMDAAKLIQVESKMDDWEKQMLDIPAVLKVEVEVVKQYKGTPVTENIIIYTARNSSSCGFGQFTKDESFLIYGDEKSYLYQLFSPKMNTKNIEKSGTFWTSHCTRTTASFEGEVAVLESL